jgi:hypothetical protein
MKFIDVYAPVEFETVLEKENRMKKYKTDILGILTSLSQEV